MSAASPTTAADAQRRLDELHAEQRGLPAALTAARRAGDVAAYLQLETRREDLTGEVDAAQAAVYRLRLAEAWTLAEECAAAEPGAEAALTTARAECDAHAGQRPDPTRPAEDTITWQAEQEQLAIVVARADQAAREARDATATALAAIDDLEDGVELITGERPPAGDGLRAAPRPLACNFVLPHPDRPVSALSLQAGTIPPRWAAWQLRNNPAAFLDAPGNAHPRWDQVDAEPQRGVNIVSVPTLDGAFGGWDPASVTDAQAEAMRTSGPRINPASPTVRYLAGSLPTFNVNASTPRGSTGDDPDVA